PVGGASATRGDTPREGRAQSRLPASQGRRAPSLLRPIIQGLLLQPEVASALDVPRPDDGTAEAAALTALADFCAAAPGPLTTAGTMQYFAGSAHEPVLVAALASASDHQV